MSNLQELIQLQAEEKAKLQAETARLRDQMEASYAEENRRLRIELKALADLSQPNGEFEFTAELQRARKKFPAMVSAHEGYAVILEELDELWDIIKQKQTERDYTLLRKETVQLGAMVLAFLTEICDAENRR